jgi:hypothetical protein
MLELGPSLFNKSLLIFCRAHFFFNEKKVGLTRYGWAKNVWFRKTFKRAPPHSGPLGLPWSILPSQ